MRVYCNSESSTHSFSFANLRGHLYHWIWRPAPYWENQEEKEILLPAHIWWASPHFAPLSCPRIFYSRLSSRHYNVHRAYPVAGTTCFRPLHQDFSTKGLLHPLSGRYCEDKDGLYFQSMYMPFRPEIDRIIGWLSGPLLNSFPFGQKWAIFQEKNSQLHGKGKGGRFYI